MNAHGASFIVPVLPSAFQHTLEVWLVMHRDLKSMRRVRLLFDWLAVGLADYVKGRPAGASAGGRPDSVARSRRRTHRLSE